jgi:hypothetical protein
MSWKYKWTAGYGIGVEPLDFTIRDSDRRFENWKCIILMC